MRVRVLNVTTGEYYYEDVTDSVYSISIDEVKQVKIQEITDSYHSSTQTFQSSALGTLYTYLADDASMSKFNAEYTYINSTSYGSEPILWYTVEAGGVNHTKDQFNQVWLDGRTTMSNAFSKWDSLVKQVSSYTSDNDINTVLAISW